MAAVDVNRSSLIKKIAGRSPGNPPPGNVPKRNKNISNTVQTEPQTYDFGLSISGVDLINSTEDSQKDVRVQFVMVEDKHTQETTYDLHADPLPDTVAVFMTDLPSDPHFHGYNPDMPSDSHVHSYNPDSLDSAFNDLSEQISNMFSADVDTYSTDIQSTSGSEHQLTSILKKRPQSANNPKHANHRTRRRPKSAAAAKDSRYLLVNRPRTDGMNAEDDVSCDAASPAIHIEPVVFSYNTGEQIGGFLPEESEDRTAKVVENVEPADESPESDTHSPLSVPNTIAHLLPWRVDSVPQYITGIDTSQCVVLLPCCDVTRGDTKAHDIRRVVPPPQAADHELNFIEKVSAPKPLIKTKRPMEGIKCVHGRTSEHIATPRIKIYASDGQVLHETQSEQRDVGIVRKEIQELEDLMLGIGSFDGCLVVQLQAEINQINETLGEMWPRLEEIRRREEEKSREEETTDFFGMKAFYRQHDDVIRQIRHQHRLCVLELSDVETDLGIDTNRAYFKTHKANIRPRRIHLNHT